MIIGPLHRAQLASSTWNYKYIYAFYAFECKHTGFIIHDVIKMKIQKKKETNNEVRGAYLQLDSKDVSVEYIYAE